MKKKSYRTKIVNNKFCICKNKINKEINFGNLPLINNYKRNIVSEKFPVTISQCTECRLIQLKYSVLDKFLFPKNYSYLSSNSQEKINNFKLLAKKISKKSKIKNPKILDIGCNDGSLLKIFKNKKFNTLGIEPTNTANLAKKKKLNVVNKSLNLNIAKKILKKYSKFDFITAINIVAHTNNPDVIFKSIKILLKKNGILIIDVQYLYNLIANKGFDSFHHEHKSYFTLSSIIKILNNFNIFPFDAQIVNVHGGILRVYAGLVKKPFNNNIKKILRKENDKKIYQKIINLNLFRKNFNLRIKKLLNDLKNKKSVIYGIGAAPRSCVMLNSSNLNKSHINLVGEVPGSLKCEKFIPGTNIIVKNENRIITDKPDFVVILAWHLKSNIIKILRKKGYKGSFIVPLPNLKIIKK